jgi:hypothetical protein
MQILDMDVDSSSINGIVDIPRDGGLSNYGKTWGHDDIGTIILCAESSTRSELLSCVRRALRDLPAQIQ